MIRRCFRYEVDLNVHKVDGYKFSKCLIRNKEVILTPEEEVRQSVLFYLIYYSSIDLKKFLIRVESQSLDIAFYLKQMNAQFQPYQYPKMIFELKRDQSNLPDYVNQLKNYMVRLKCNHGILTDSNEILYVSQQNGFLCKSSSITEVEQLLSSFDSNLEEDLQSFFLAQMGDYESLKLLVHKYGKTSKFTLLTKDFSPPIQCIYLRQKGEQVFYDISDHKAKKKQFVLDRNRFIKLLSINE
jgi:hypothetical protein